MDKNIPNISTVGLFKDFVNLESVTLSNNQLFVESMFENDAKLSTLNFNRNLNITNIPTRTFYNSAAFDTFDISKLNITTIASSAFENSHLKNIVMPETISQIGDFAFKNSLKLLSVDMSKLTTPNLVIDEQAFMNCANLASLLTPESQVVTELTLKTRAFANVFVPTFNFRYFKSIVFNGANIFDSSWNVRDFYLPITFSEQNTTWIHGFIYNQGISYKINLWVSSKYSFTQVADKLGYSLDYFKRWFEYRTY